MTIRIWGFVALAVMLIAALTAGVRGVYKAGYNKRSLEVSEAATEEQNKAVEARVQEWIDTQEAAEPVIIVEEKIVEKIRVVEKKIPVEVKKIIVRAPECADLGDGYAGLRNEQIRAANSIQDESP